MREKERILINDDLFLKTLTCSLKYVHLTNNDDEESTRQLLFRQRNKLHVRDAIALRFQNCKHTSNSVQKAADETRSWLEEELVAICGAVLRYENLLTRVPILVKERERLTIIQVHGRLRKRSEQNEINTAGKNRSITRYLMKAAFRLHVIRKCFPEADIEVLFYFPKRHFKSSVDHLNLFTEDGSFREEFDELFSQVKATEGVNKVCRNIPEIIAHKSFESLPISEVIQKMEKIGQDTSNFVNIERHEGCKYCEFRLPNPKNLESCWDRFLPTKNIKHPERHIFELIGHGNSTETENQSFYQENAALSAGYDSFEKINKQGGPSIIIHQRRSLQILQAKDERVPEIWIKPEIRVLESLEYPLHFIDFEAATYSLPMKKETRPYEPVYFQFSCHTLFDDGELVHSEWLDKNHDRNHPHEDFVDQLSGIPKILEGTIVQYSPFEKQAVNRLISDFKRNPTLFESQIQILKQIRKSDKPGYENRFFDLSKLIQENYFNKYFMDGLGLKPVLTAVLQWENQNGSYPLPNVRMEEVFPDPYNEIQRPGFKIADGSAAMNAWLALKNGLLNPDEETQITTILKKYCALDSYALFVIFNHLKRFLPEVSDEDFVRF